jgi:SAM-dependent methyltransferase
MSDPHAIPNRPTYHAEHFEPLFASEERHFWFRSRNRCIAAATRLIPNVASVKDIIEHGCGTGFVLAELQRLFPQARVTGADLFAEGLALARRRFAGPLLQTDILNCNLFSAFDLVGLFDVLEHLDDDVQVLRAIRGQLRPGGCLLLTVPAHMALWSDYDEASGHRRRYSCRQLVACLSEAGFELEYCTEFMFALLPLLFVRRRLKWGRARSGKETADVAKRIEAELKINPLANRMLEWLLRPEPWWIEHGRKLPGGTSLLALARKDTAGTA